MSPPSDAAPLGTRTLADIEHTLGATITEMTKFDSLASRVYAVTFADGREVVVKIPQVEQGRLSEPRLIDMVDEGTDVPVPSVLAIREDHEPSYFVMNRLAGDTAGIVSTLAPENRLGLAREFGAILGDLHGLSLPVSTFGRFRADEAGELETIEEFDTWRPRFEDLMAVNLDALAELRLGDLTPRLREAFDERIPNIPNVTTPQLNYFDCKPANLVLSQADEGPLIRAVLDWEGLSTTHWAFTLAYAERNLVEWPGDAEPGERDRLREELYDAYAGARGWEQPDLGPWYDTYRLATYALVAASPYWLDGRDDWDDEKAARLRCRIERFLDD